MAGRVRSWLGAVMGLCLICATPSYASAEPVTIFAAASLKPALDQIAARAAENPDGVQLRLSYAGSSALARQIQYGAPAQLFISANSDWMDVLDQQGLLNPGSRVDLLGNRLVLIAAPGISGDKPLAATLRELPDNAHLAMGLLRAVPAGIYGREALETLDVWTDVQPHVVQGDNVRTALRLVASGEAEYGIVYATDPGPDAKVQVVDVFPDDSHTPIRYPLAMIGAPTPLTQRVYDFLRSGSARDVFQAHGFIPLEPEQ